MNKYGIIGFGNVGKAFVEGLLAKDIINKENIYVFAKSVETLTTAIELYGVKSTDNLNTLLNNSDTVFLAVKKNVFIELMNTSDVKLFTNKKVISFIAGMSIGEIKQCVGNDCEVIKAMPNLSISNGNGIIGYTPTDCIEIKNILGNLGYAFEVSEADIEKVTAFSACGLGFAAYLINAYIKAGEQLGFDAVTSKLIAEQNFLSAINKSNYSDTMVSVATKGGATEAGINYLNKAGVDKSIVEAVHAAYEKLSS